MTNSEATCESNPVLSRNSSSYLCMAILGTEFKIIIPTFDSLSSGGCFAEGPLNPIGCDLQQSSDSLVYEIKC